MFKLDENIRNIDSSDSEDGEESPRKKQPQDSAAPTTSLPGKPSKKRRWMPSAKNPVLKKMLWLLIGSVVFGVVCFVSAPMLRQKLAAPKIRSEPSVWWREATTTEQPEHLELTGGHYVFAKKAWEGLEAPASLLPHPTPVIVVSNSEGDSCFDFAKCASVVRAMQERHMAHLPDIGFNFLIGGDGNVYEGRGWDAQSFHRGADRVLGICFLGDYNFGKKELLQGQIEAAKELLKYGVRMGKIAEDYVIVASNQVVGHTSIPGGNVLKVISKLPRWDPTLFIQ